MPRFASSLASITLLCLASCTDPVPALELGTGLDRFEPIEEGADIAMIEGAQGGWHLWVSFRARGLEREGARVEVVAWPLEAGRPTQSTYVTSTLHAHDGWDEHLGLAAPFSAPECYQDRAVVLEANLTDRDGVTVTDRRVVVPRWPTTIGECPR